MRKLNFETEEERQNYLKEYKKRYYEENKAKIKAQQEETMHCEYCNKDVFAYRYKRHCKSKSHQEKVQLGKKTHCTHCNVNVINYKKHCESVRHKKNVEAVPKIEATTKVEIEA